MDLGEMTTNIKEILKKVAHLFSRALPKAASSIMALFQKSKSREDSAASSANEENPLSQVLPMDDDPPGGSLSQKKLGALSNYFRSVENKYLSRFPSEKRRLILFGIGGTAALFFVFVIAIPAVLSGRSGQAAPISPVSGFVIPAEELFIPSEPDFLPEFILEREPRSFWSLDDLRPHWRVLEGTELWREQVTSEVDRIMEGVR